MYAGGFADLYMKKFLLALQLQETRINLQQTKQKVTRERVTSFPGNRRWFLAYELAAMSERYLPAETEADSTKPLQLPSRSLGLYLFISSRNSGVLEHTRITTPPRQLPANSLLNFRPLVPGNPPVWTSDATRMRWPGSWITALFQPKDDLNQR